MARVAVAQLAVSAVGLRPGRRNEFKGFRRDCPPVVNRPSHVGFVGEQLISGPGIRLLSALEALLKMAERLAACLENTELGPSQHTQDDGNGRGRGAAKR